MSDLNETEIKVFIDAVTNYFNQLTHEPASVRGAFLDDNGGTAPVFDYSGQIVLALTAAGPGGIFDIAWEGSIARALRACAQQISQRLGAPASRLIADAV